ncbi:hypothetical protein ACLVWU_10110 [Bdellovibrio sp. HCB290]|uniref:hypothetical protein n=1 Tax=Bdellovibrio sp. HCB290 TaxID=3394356 RepID=UPI0039B6CE5D
MKTTVLLFTVALAMTTSAFASNTGFTKVPEKLYSSLQAEFPEAVAGGNHSQDILLERFTCYWSRTIECTGFTADGKFLVLEDENAVKNMINVLNEAGVPHDEYLGRNWIQVDLLSCSHVMPGSGPDFFECMYNY